MPLFRILCLLLLPTCCLASPEVVVTLKPIHSLVAGVMEGVGTPKRLLPDGASPHTFQNKPSSLKMLNQADLIIWIGPQLETFMVKAVENTNPKYGTLTLSALPTMNMLPQRSGREWEGHSHDDGHDHHDHNHDLGNADPHLWLSVDNAIIIVDEVAKTLSTIDPVNANQYKTNADKRKKELLSLKSSLSTLLTPVHNTPFLVYHDGYQYFEHEFDLNAKGTMLTNPHLPLSAYGLKKIKEQIKSQHIKCVFRETEFNEKLIQPSLKGTSVKIAELDPLGMRQKEGPENYFQTMMQMGKTMHECLQ